MSHGLATTLDRRGIWHYGGGEDKKSRLWSLPPLLRVHRQLMIAGENMLSSVTATGKLKTLIKLTGSLPFPNPSTPNTWQKPGLVLHVKEHVLQTEA